MIPRSIRRLLLLSSAVGILVSGAAMLDKPVLANESTCCTYASDCAGTYDICCPATCGASGKQCLQCKEAGCRC